MTGARRRRTQVLDLRVRLERAAASAFDQTCRPDVRDRQTTIPVRLLFLVALVDEDQRAHARRLARLGAHVYARSSDVLHGRVRALDLDESAVAEWRSVVEELERVVSARDPGDIGCR